MLLQNTVDAKSTHLGMASLASLLVLDLAKLMSIKPLAPIPPRDFQVWDSHSCPGLDELQLSALLVTKERTWWISVLVHPFVFWMEERDPRCCPQSSWKCERLVQKQGQSLAPGSRAREKLLGN